MRTCVFYALHWFFVSQMFAFCRRQISKSSFNDSNDSKIDIPFTTEPLQMVTHAVIQSASLPINKYWLVKYPEECIEKQRTYFQ